MSMVKPLFQTPIGEGGIPNAAQMPGATTTPPFQTPIGEGGIPNDILK